VTRKILIITSACWHQACRYEILSRDWTSRICFCLAASSMRSSLDKTIKNRHFCCVSSISDKHSTRWTPREESEKQTQIVVSFTNLSVTLDPWQINDRKVPKKFWQYQLPLRIDTSLPKDYLSSIFFGEFRHFPEAFTNRLLLLSHLLQLSIGDCKTGALLASKGWRYWGLR